MVDSLDSGDQVPGRSLLRSSAAHVIVPDPASLDADVIDVADDVAHHLSRVVRLRSGQSVTVTDGAGRWRMTEFVGAASGARLTATSAVVVEPARPTVTIASAIPKGDRLDWMVQKLTELGVGRLVLLDAERSAVRWAPDRATKQLERLGRIAAEACRQSRRVWSFDIEGPVEAFTVLPSAVAAEPGGRSIGDGDRIVAVGPEGGWTDDELTAAIDRVSLARTILRIETAAITAAVQADLAL